MQVTWTGGNWYTGTAASAGTLGTKRQLIGGAKAPPAMRRFELHGSVQF